MFTRPRRSLKLTTGRELSQLAAQAGDRRRHRRSRRHRHRGAVTRRWGEHGVRGLERAADDGKPRAVAGGAELLQREHPRPEHDDAAAGRQPRPVHDHRLRRPGRVDTDLQLLHGGPGLQNASGWTSYPPVTPADGRLFLWTDYTSMTTASRTAR